MELQVAAMDDVANDLTVIVGFLDVVDDATRNTRLKIWCCYQPN